MHRKISRVQNQNVWDFKFTAFIFSSSYGKYEGTPHYSDILKASFFQSQKGMQIWQTWRGSFSSVISSISSTKICHSSAQPNAKHFSTTFDAYFCWLILTMFPVNSLIIVDRSWGFPCSSTCFSKEKERENLNEWEDKNHYQYLYKMNNMKTIKSGSIQARFLESQQERAESLRNF